jgi:hypothetical protein
LSSLSFYYSFCCNFSPIIVSAITVSFILLQFQSFHYSFGHYVTVFSYSITIYVITSLLHVRFSIYHIDKSCLNKMFIKIRFKLTDSRSSQINVELGVWRCRSHRHGGSGDATHANLNAWQRAFGVRSHGFGHGLVMHV